MPVTPSTLSFFVLDEDSANLASVDTPVETVMGDNGLLLWLDYFTTEGIEGVLFGLSNGFLFDINCGAVSSSSELSYLLSQIMGIALQT